MVCKKILIMMRLAVPQQLLLFNFWLLSAFQCYFDSTSATERLKRNEGVRSSIEFDCAVLALCPS